MTWSITITFSTPDALSGDPVVIDQIIKALGLGSSGHRYGDLPSNSTQTPGSRYRRADLVDLTSCPTPTISPSQKVCPEYTSGKIIVR